LLENPAYREQFIGRCADLLNSTLNSSNVIARVDEYASLLEPEMTRETSRWIKDNAHPGQWNENVESMRAFARRCPDQLRQFVVDQFSLTGLGTLRISISGPAEARIGVNSIRPSNFPWEGVYFQGTPVRLEALPAVGQSFLHWQLPGGGVDTNPVLTWTLQPGVTEIMALFAGP
jgi:hypothetical protein